MRLRPIHVLLPIALQGIADAQTTLDAGMQPSIGIGQPVNPLAAQPAKLINPKPTNDKAMAPVQLKEPSKPTIIQSTKLGSVAPERYDLRDATYPSPAGTSLMRRLEEPEAKPDAVLDKDSP